MLKVENLCKKYGNRLAVDDISFTIKQGEIVGLLGANGAGKSSTMNMITGYIPPTSGQISIYDYDMQSNSRKAKSFIGYLPEIPPLYLDMTVYEQLDFVCRLKSIEKSKITAEINRVCELTNINNVCKRMIRNLSKGYRQRTGLAQALVGESPLLVLDEPTVGLDPQQIIDIRDLIKSLQKKHSIIISSHNLSEIASICNRILVMKSGKLIADNTPDHLYGSFSGENLIELRVKGEKSLVLKAIDKIEGIEYFNIKDSAEEFCIDYVIKAKNNHDVRQDLFFNLAEVSCPILIMRSKNPTLEDVFLELTT